VSLPPGIKERRVPKGVRRGVSALPVLFTLGNLFCGFWALIHVLHERYADAAPLIGIAIVLDLLDGRIARMTGTTSEFGGELDSLADVISFGVAPALMLYRWGFDSIDPTQQTLARLGWFVAFLFVTCGALRLARFNVQRNVIDSRYFVGLPIPAGAAQVAAVVYAAPDRLTDPKVSIVVLAASVCLALLMVSTVRYRSFKSLDLRSRRSYFQVFLIAAAIGLVALNPQWMLLATATFYTISGPIMQVVSLVRRRGDNPPPMVPHEAH
jgi:CDP-diacylglycerol---serine O-phosphatidyltransferase